MRAHRLHSLVWLALPVAVMFVLSIEQASFAESQPWNKIVKRATSRFKVVLNGEAVYDKETGLVWERNPSTTSLEWITAIDQAPNRVVGERKGWRVPTVEELLTLVDPTQSDPALPSGHPFGNVATFPERYWTATTYVNDPNGALTVRFLDGTAVFQLKHTVFHRVWLVRGGHGYNSQFGW